MNVTTRDPDGLTRLAARLREAGYTATTLHERLGLTYPDDVGLLNHAAALERVAGDRSAAATLIRLFFLEATEPSRHIAALFRRRDHESLVSSGVLHERGGKTRARVRIDPIGDQYFAADRRFRALDSRALRLSGRDPVYPPSSDSLLLRDAIVAPEARRALDVCTGSGIQALQRARTVEQVIAVDINARAAAIARFNAQLNGVDNVEVRIGDLYAPVRDHQFDLIIANPPFVSSPYATGPAYHAGGPTGDRVLRRIIGGWGKYLRPGGRAFAISHLAVRRGEDVQSIAARWFSRFPGRALVLVLETGTPIDLAAAQALFALEHGLTAYAAEVRRWVDYLRRHRIAAVSLLLIVAARDARAGVDVVDAHPRVLPLPLTPGPADRIAAWLQ